VFFDKTGTLTSGEPRVTIAVPATPTGGGRDDARWLALAAAVERHSEHPVARAVVAFAEAKGAAVLEATGFRAAPGRGASALVDGVEIRVGTAAFSGVAGAAGRPGATEVYVSADSRLLGRLELQDSARPSAAAAVTELRALGLRAEILSGDNAAAVAVVAASVGLEGGAGSLTPEEKVRRIGGDAVSGADSMAIMVGDGINDAPALSRAAVGVTLESGTDLARELADVTILGGDLTRLPWLVKLSRATLRVARWNLFWAFFYNLVGVALAVSGRLHPLFGAAAMIVSSLIVVLNSQRLTRIRI
jgi:P-type E1-E2 ATPase